MKRDYCFLSSVIAWDICPRILHVRNMYFWMSLMLLLIVLIELMNLGFKRMQDPSSTLKMD